MIMMGLKFMGDVPFRDVYITGLDPRRERREDVEVQGQHHRPARHHRRHRRSRRCVAKRTSGLMQPQHAAGDREGDAQAVSRRHRRATAPTRCASRSPRWPARRATSASTSAASSGYRNFCNKLWNARALRADDGRRREAGDLIGAAELSVADRWIVSRLAATLAQVDARTRATIASTSPRTALVRVHLVRVLRLVPRAHQAGAAGRDRDRRAEARHAPHAGRRCSRRCCARCIR